MLIVTDADSAVAKDIASACLRGFTAGGAVPPGTLIGAKARMAGTYLFRSFHLQTPGLQLGQAVLSTQANEHAPGQIRIACFGFVEGAKTAPDPVCIQGGTAA